MSSERIAWQASPGACVPYRTEHPVTTDCATRYLRHLLDWLSARKDFKTVVAGGHRIVHGVQHTEPESVTPELLQELRSINSYVPDHLPLEIDLTEAFQRHHTQRPQAACFATSFHRTM